MNKDLINLQKVELKILKDTAKFCDDNGIEYFLISGTLLGAVRHGGFIPWDDDIDIGMDLCNYKKFIEVAPRSFSNKYFIQNFHSETKYPYPWTKIRLNGTTSMDARMKNLDIHSGVFLDIFLINGMSNNKIYRKLQSILARSQRILLRKYYYIDGKTNKPYNKLLYRLLPEPFRVFLIRVFDKIINIDCSKTEFCYNTYSSNVGEEKQYRSEWFKGLIKMKFVDDYFSVPNEPEKYLEADYGDWQTPPPESERIGHGDIIIDLENDYTLYQETTDK